MIMMNKLKLEENTSNYLNVLSSLLAQENLQMTFSDTAQTAYIDLRTKTITLPSYTVTSASANMLLAERLVCHEVAHAMFTPFPRSKKTLKEIYDTDYSVEEHVSYLEENKQLASSLLQILEDIRIENLFMKKFPGSAALFARGFAEFVKVHNNESPDNKIDVYNTNFLIEKLNYLFKSNHTIFYNFTDEEVVFVDRCRKMFSVYDMFSLCYDLLKYMRDNNTDDEIQQYNTVQGNKENSSDDSSSIEVITSNTGREEDMDDENDDEEDGKELDDNNEGNNGGDESGDKIDSKDNSKEGVNGNNDESGEEEDDSNTSDVEDSGKKEEEEDVDHSKNDSLGASGIKGAENNSNKKLSDNELSDLLNSVSSLLKPSKNQNKSLIVIPNETVTIVGAKEFSSILRKFNTSCGVANDANTSIRKTIQKINKEANELSIEFNRRKTAKEFRRTINQPTGTLDSKKFHKYKTSKDIFKTLSKLPRGKNHEVIIFLDWSVSIEDVHFDLIRQACVICFFCKKNNIPFKMFAFSCAIEKNYVSSELYDRLKNNPGEFLIELMNNNQTVDEITYDLLFYSGFVKSYLYTKPFPLGSTPLLSCLERSIGLFKKLNDPNKVTNLIILSDGQSNENKLMRSRYSKNDMIFDQAIGQLIRSNQIISACGDYTNSAISHNEMYTFLFTRLRKVVSKLNVLTIHIGSMYSNGFIPSWDRARKYEDNLNKDGVVMLNLKGFFNITISKKNVMTYEKKKNELLINDSKIDTSDKKETKKVIGNFFKEINSSLSKKIYQKIADQIS